MYKKILIPLDSSRLAGASCPLSFRSLAREGTTHFNVDAVAARLTESREYLAPVAADLRRQGVRVTTDARYGEPMAEIVVSARETRADLIAMTTHGRSGFGRPLFGSVAESRHAAGRLRRWLL
jgi:nucleotide-binding universal stress UspA family protein